MQQLIGNTFIIGIGSSLSKILLFLLVPILTRELTPTEYGYSEIIINTINLILPIFTIVIFEAVLRFTLDDTLDCEDVFSIGLRVTLKGSAAVFVLVCFARIFYDNRLILLLSFLLYFCDALKQCFVYYARGKNKFALIACNSTLCGALLLIFVLVFVSFANKGIVGYLLAQVLSNLFCVLFYFLGLRVNFFNVLKRKNAALQSKMVRYSLPMVLNSTGWWINNVADRYMLSTMDSVSITGIYSVSYKIPGLLNTLVDIFMQAWKVVATSEYEKGEKKHYTKGFHLFVYASILICSCIVIFSKLFSKFFFGAEFTEAWKYSVILVLGFLFNGISGYLGTIFTALKSTKHIAASTLLGGGVNIVLNLALIPFFSATGAAIATCISNVVVCLYRLFKLKGYLEGIRFNYKMYLLISVLIFNSCLVLSESFPLVTIAIAFMIVLISGALFIQTATSRKK